MTLAWGCLWDRPAQTKLASTCVGHLQFHSPRKLEKAKKRKNWERRQADRKGREVLGVRWKRVEGGRGRGGGSEGGGGGEGGERGLGDDLYPE